MAAKKVLMAAAFRFAGVPFRFFGLHDFREKSPTSALLGFPLKETFFFQLLHQRSVYETCRIGAGGFAAETLQ